MTKISNRSYHNRQPRQAHKSDRREYEYVNCGLCGSPYAVPIGEKLIGCWMCDYLSIKGVTIADADKLAEIVDGMKVEQSDPLVTPAWMQAAQAEHTDWLDNNRTMEDAR